MMRTVVVTGAAGRIGRYVRRALRAIYPEIRCSDLAPPPDLAADEIFVAADLADPGAVERLLQGAQAVVHLGGVSAEASWEAIRRANIDGCYHLFEAARRMRVERVVFASSNHAVGFYPRQRRIAAGAPVRPDSRYGVSKAFGEALAALYAYKHGLRVTCIRIGHFGPRPVDRRRLSIWVEPDDLVQLIRIGLEHPDIRCETFFGVSDNAQGWWDNAAAFRYGYRPHGRSDDHREAALAAQQSIPPDPVGDWYQGGSFCSDEFDGGIERSPT